MEFTTNDLTVKEQTLEILCQTALLSRTTATSTRRHVPGGSLWCCTRRVCRKEQNSLPTKKNPTNQTMGASITNTRILSTHSGKSDKRTQPWLSYATLSFPHPQLNGQTIFSILKKISRNRKRSTVPLEQGYHNGSQLVRHKVSDRKTKILHGYRLPSFLPNLNTTWSCFTQPLHTRIKRNDTDGWRTTATDSRILRTPQQVRTQLSSRQPP